MIHRKLVKAVLHKTEAGRLLQLAAVIPLLLVGELLHAQSLSIRVLSESQPPQLPVGQVLVTQPAHPHSFNAFDHRQLGPLLQEAQARQEAEQHQAALKIFKKAWQISRINNGLYHESQIPLLENIIFSEIQLRDWAALDKRYSYMEYLYRRLYALDDPRLEEGLRKVSSFHVNAIYINLDGNREYHLQRAAELFQLRLRVAELTLEKGHPRFEFLNEGLATSRRQLYSSSLLSQDSIRDQSYSRHASLLSN